MKRHIRNGIATWGTAVMASLGFATVAASMVAAVNSPTINAQSPPATTADLPKFEVASVKPNKSGVNRVLIGVQPGGRFTTTNTPLRFLIRYAYQVQDFQIVGGPDWIASENFDIMAKAEGDPPPTPPGTVGQLQLMMRSLLADRFKLVTHLEKRDLPIYALVLAREDGKLGPGLSQSTVDCEAMRAEARGRGGAPPAPPAPGQRPVCGMMMGRGQIRGGGFPLSQLAASLSQTVQRVVVDKTGLTGNYDLDLTFNADMTQDAQGTTAAVDTGQASIFTAVQEQLGLKLDSQRGPVDVVVIDRVEPPTPD